MNNRAYRYLPDGLKPFLSVADTAELLGVHPRTVLRKIEAGILPAIRTGTTRGKLRIPRQALAEFLEVSRV